MKYFIITKNIKNNFMFEWLKKWSAQLFRGHAVGCMLYDQKKTLNLMLHSIQFVLQNLTY